MNNPAPFHQDVALGPADVRALWVTASDGARLRIGIWPNGTKGTVLLFPGRTEYVEKYARIAGEFNTMGYAVIAIDWRGQGLSDRDLADRNTGHIGDFLDYQHDVAAMLDCARGQNLPQPYYLLAHSMGGCIGLRALMQDLPVKAACFSSPMWGIALAGVMRPVAWSTAWAAQSLGLGHRYIPSGKPETYVNLTEFAGNQLTSDPDQYAYMKNQTTVHPELALGSPSLSWLYTALSEARDLADTPAPNMPTITFLGANERIVDTAPVHARMANWPGGTLHVMPGAEHEVLLEKPEIRNDILAKIKAHFDAHT